MTPPRTAWLINHYAKTPDEPGGTRHDWLAHHLIDHDWHMPIVRAASGESRGLHQHGRVTLLNLPASEYQGNGFGPVRNMAGFALKAARVKPEAALRPPDVVIGSSVHPLTAWAGLRQARRFGVPFIFEIRDLWPQTLVDSPMHRPLASAFRAVVGDTQPRSAKRPTRPRHGEQPRTAVQAAAGYRGLGLAPRPVARRVVRGGSRQLRGGGACAIAPTEVRPLPFPASRQAKR